MTEPLTYLKDPAIPAGFVSAVADNFLEFGKSYDGLTGDDVGGLRYLLSSNNVNYESLPPGVSAAGGDSGVFVKGAWRPGVEKITFVRHPCDSQSSQFLAATNQFTDTYFTNGALERQLIQRVSEQPDFLFSEGDTFQKGVETIPFLRSGTSNWMNHAALNGKAGGAGPGVIQPPVQITFAKLGRLLVSSGSPGAGITEDEAFDFSTFWGRLMVRRMRRFSILFRMLASAS